MDQFQGLDVIVVGGGPSGLMAAITAQENGARTLLIDKGHKLGRKLGISGGGRCNVTNNKALPELMANIPGNSRFLYSALTQFGPPEIREFFENLGIRLKEEDHGRIFPVSDKAATVVEALVRRLYDSGCEVLVDCPVAALVASEDRMVGVRLNSGVIVEAPTVVLAVGGASVPATGSTGDGYPWARSLGHRIVDPYPTEVPITSSARLIVAQQLKGLSIRETTLTLWSDLPKPLATESGDMMFAHFGLTGPAALRLSHYVSTERLKHPDQALTVQVDLAPEWSQARLRAAFLEHRTPDGRKAVATILNQYLPERLAKVLVAEYAVDGEQRLSQMTANTVERLVSGMKGFKLPIDGTLPLTKATVTGGGVSVLDIVPSTMASKRCAGLYFCGEVMDVHAHTGGYNITVAFSTGWLAGLSAAQVAQTARHSMVDGVT